MTTTRSLSWLAFGQSYAAEGYTETAAYWALSELLRRAISANAAAVSSRTGRTVTAGDITQRIQTAVSGSAILQANAASAGYWVSDSLTDGPLLTSAIAKITASVLPSFGLWSHFEQDASALTGGASGAAAVRTAATYLLGRIRSMQPAPGSWPVFCDMLGPRYAADVEREWLVRNEMIVLIDGAETALYRGVEKYALPLDSTVHPTEGGYRQMGAHAGRKVAHWLTTGAELRGPQIGTVSRAGLVVSVPIITPAGQTLVKPLTPRHFGLVDAGGAEVPITAMSWSGDTLKLTAASTPARLRYPVAAPVDVTQIVRLAGPPDPIYSGEPGLVLESAAERAL